MGRKGFLSKAGEKRLERFLGALDDATRHPGEEAVHDLRVAIRRMLAFLALAERLPGGEMPFPREFRTSLKALMRPLGRLRDAHVKLIRIGQFVPHPGPCTRRYRIALLSDTDRWEETVARTLHRTRPGFLRKAFRAIPLSPLPLHALEESALSQLRARETGVARLADDWLASPAPEPLHEMRIAFKAYRYTAEAMASLLPGMTGDAEARLHAFQTLLGDIHDFDVLLADAGHFREKVLELPDLRSDLEEAVAAAREESLAKLLDMLQNARGGAGLFALR
ncbi:MAG TPA: CHAD domain-containing protein [Candidatus Deferrimicrobiaceae bacterium]